VRVEIDARHRGRVARRSIQRVARGRAGGGGSTSSTS
jgi:hypothetical protein